jgi:hypothetical protein
VHGANSRIKKERKITMTKEEAIKYLQQLYPNGGHCWLDEQRIEAVSMAINALQEEPASEDLGEYINKLSKQFPEVSFAKLSRIAVRVAKWQKTNLWKPADGRELSEIDRDVICLLDCGKVVKAHRPSKKDNLCVPETYGKGGWSYPNIKYWLDIKLPKEIEL